MQWVKAAAMVSVNLTICILVGVRIGVRYRRGSARKRSCTSVGLSSFTMLWICMKIPRIPNQYFLYRQRCCCSRCHCRLLLLQSGLVVLLGVGWRCIRLLCLWSGRLVVSVWGWRLPLNGLGQYCDFLWNNSISIHSWNPADVGS